MIRGYRRFTVRGNAGPPSLQRPRSRCFPGDPGLLPPVRRLAGASSLSCALPAAADVAAVAPPGADRLRDPVASGCGRPCGRSTAMQPCCGRRIVIRRADGRRGPVLRRRSDVCISAVSHRARGGCVLGLCRRGAPGPRLFLSWAHEKESDPEERGVSRLPHGASSSAAEPCTDVPASPSRLPARQEELLPGDAWLLAFCPVSGLRLLEEAEPSHSRSLRGRQSRPLSPRAHCAQQTTRRRPVVALCTDLRDIAASTTGAVLEPHAARQGLRLLRRPVRGPESAVSGLFRGPHPWPHRGAGLALLSLARVTAWPVRDPEQSTQASREPYRGEWTGSGRAVVSAASRRGLFVVSAGPAMCVAFCGSRCGLKGDSSAPHAGTG